MTFFQLAGRTVQVGNGDTNGVLPTGTITVNDTLSFNRSDSALTVFGVISGGGTLVNNGTGTVTLNGTETLTGPTIVNAGTLALTGPNAAASTISASSGLTINNGGTVEVVSDNSLGNPTTGGGLAITVNAGGTLTGLGTANTGGGTSSHIRGLLTLNGGNLAMQGLQVPVQTHGAWNLDGGVTVPGGPATSIISALNVVPTQVGGTTFNIGTGTTVSGIDLLISGTLNNASAAADTGIIKSGPGVMALDANNTYSHNTTINQGILQVGTAADTNALTSPLGAAAGTVTITGGSVLNLASSKGVTVANAINDDGSAIVLVSSGNNIFTGANTYSGSTVVQGGSLALTGTGSINNSASIIVSNATLNVSASTTPVADSGAVTLLNGTFNVGTNLVTSLGSLTASNSALVFPVNPVTPVITGVNVLTTSGQTNVIRIPTLPGLPLYPTNFTLISYGSFSGVDGGNNLTNLGVNLPAAGSPVGYLTNLNNSIQLVLLSGLGPVNPNPTNVTVSVSGNQLTLTWPADHTGWQLQVQTNSLATGLGTNWVNVAGSTAVNSEVFTMNPATGSVFYRLVLP